MKQSLSLRFLYGTVPGRMVLKILVRPTLSKAAGFFLDTRLSRVLIGPFQRKNHITLEHIQIPATGFASFNAFFSRSRTADSIRFSQAPDALCSPCDAFLTCYSISPDSHFCIKNSRYSLSDLLCDDTLASGFTGGLAMIFRLTPAHYHRYHFIDDASPLKQKRIEGVLHCVRPIATEAFPVYVQNSREYTLLHSDHLHDIVQMEVGALMVGRICNHPLSDRIKRGAEKGCFAFGGSTIILLLKQDTVALSSLPDCLDNDREVPVVLGQQIGTVLLAD